MYLCMFAEILKAFDTLPLPIVTVTTTASTTVSQQSTRSTTVHHTSSVSSVIRTTTGVSSVTQLPQGVLIIIIMSYVCMYLHDH